MRALSLMLLVACGAPSGQAPLPFADLPALPDLADPVDPDRPWAGCSIVQQEWRRNDLPHPGDTVGDEPGARTELVYDDRQRLVERRTWSAAPLDTPPISFDELIYEGDALVRRIAGSTATGIPSGSETFYDEEGRIGRVVLFDGYQSGRVDTELQTYFYDNGRLSQVRRDRDLDGTADDISSWRYDVIDLPDGGREETTWEFGTFDRPEAITRRTYDPDGRLVQQDDLAWQEDDQGQFVVVDLPGIRQRWRFVDGRVSERWEERLAVNSLGEQSLRPCSHVNWRYDPLGNLLTYEQHYALGTCGTLDGGSRTRWVRDDEGRELVRMDAQLDADGRWDDQTESQYVHHDTYDLPDGIAWGEVFPRSADPSYVTVVHVAPNGSTLASVRHSAWSGEVAIVDMVVQSLDPWGRLLGRVYWGLYDAPDVPTEFLLLTYTTVQAECAPPSP